MIGINDRGANFHYGMQRLKLLEYVETDPDDKSKLRLSDKAFLNPDDRPEPIELDQEVINRIKTALNAKTEKEAINFALRQFDTDIRLAETSYKDAGSFEFEAVFED